MKKYLILAVSALFVWNFSADAQNLSENRSNRQRREGARNMREMQATAQLRADRMAEKLDLTDAQKSKVAVLLEKQDTLRAKQRADFQEYRRQMEDTRSKERENFRVAREKEIKAHDAELENIIGKEKMTQWRQIRAERMQRMKQGAMDDSKEKNGVADGNKTNAGKKDDFVKKGDRQKVKKQLNKTTRNDSVRVTR